MEFSKQPGITAGTDRPLFDRDDVSILTGFEGEGNVILVKPIPDDPIEASKGMLKGKTSLVKALLRDRSEEVKRGYGNHHGSSRSEKRACRGLCGLFCSNAWNQKKGNSNHRRPRIQAVREGGKCKMDRLTRRLACRVEVRKDDNKIKRFVRPVFARWAMPRQSSLRTKTCRGERFTRLAGFVSLRLI